MIEKIVIAVDFDGVLHSFTSGWDGTQKILDPPNDGAIAWLQTVLEDGRFEVYIHSCRCWTPEGKAAMYGWLAKNGIKQKLLEEIILADRKPHARVFIDDRVIQFVGRWPTLNDLVTFKPWYEREEQSALIQTASYEDATSEEEAELIQKSEHKCFLCMHGAVCEVANAALRTEMYVTVSRCLSFTEIPAQLVGEL